MPTEDGHALIEELDEDAQFREVYARYGVAVYMAQVLEHGLVNMLVIAEKLSGEIATGQAYDDRAEKLFSKTLGDLVRRHSAANRLPDQDLELCREAVTQRNWLAHRYFRELAEDFLTPQGRQRMVDKADEARHLFTAADAACNRITSDLAAQLGVTPELVNARYAEMRRAAEERETTGGS